jgi:hypothetical protein
MGEPGVDFFGPTPHCRQPNRHFATVRFWIIVRTVRSQGRLKSMAKAKLRLVKPATENRTVPVRKGQCNDAD